MCNRGRVHSRKVKFQYTTKTQIFGLFWIARCGSVWFHAVPFYFIIFNDHSFKSLRPRWERHVAVDGWKTVAIVKQFLSFFMYVIDADVFGSYLSYKDLWWSFCCKSLTQFIYWLVDCLVLNRSWWFFFMLLLGDCFLYYWAQSRSTLMVFELLWYAGLWCYTICNRAPRRWCDHEECWCRFYCGILWVQGPPPLILSILCDAVVRKGACFLWNMLQTFYQSLRGHQICRFIMLGLHCGQIVVVAYLYAHWWFLPLLVISLIFVHGMNFGI